MDVYQALYNFGMVAHGDADARWKPSGVHIELCSGACVFPQASVGHNECVPDMPTMCTSSNTSRIVSVTL